MSVAMDEFPRRHRITVEEYYRMVEVGLLAPDARTELIEGEIVDMPAPGSRHSAVVDLLTELLVRMLGDHAIVRVQSAVRLDNYSEPLPDLALLKRRPDFYVQRHPLGPDTLLVIEVSETTLRYDRQRKAPLYAQHGVPELWVFDTQRKQLYVSRTPTPAGYRETFTADQLSSMQLAALPGLTVDVSSVIAL